MSHPFMKTFYAKTFDRDAYIAYLASQYLMFSELEQACAKHRSSTALAAVYDEDLLRSTALEQDLAFWAGESWKEKVATPSVHTAAYIKLLRSDAQDPWMLLCHHFLQYNAVLSGGQYLGAMVSSRAEEEPGVILAERKSGLLGAAFYDFPSQCQPTHGHVQKYIESVDRLAISGDLRERMLQCMRSVYAILLALFDEAYAMAPVAGMSYQEAKVDAASSSQAKKKKGPPPPPLVPENRPMTLKELSKHGPEAKQILTSVLGRIYDVSAASFFRKGGAYEMFSGHDGTWNLAVMSLKKKDIDTFEYGLDDEEKETLADWIAYFDHNYGQPFGRLLTKHSIKLSDLPRAQKIPFEDMDDEDDDEPAQSADHSATAVPTSKL